MKRIAFLTAAFFALLTTIYAQESDPKAKGILDELSKKTKAYKTMEADFTFSMVNKAKKVDETQNGSIKIKGDKYHLKIKGQEIFSNGSKIWTYIKDAEEVQVNSADDEEEETLNPSTIFTMYETGFKHRFMKEEGETQHINIYPLDPGKKKFHTVELYINKTKKQITKVVMKMKDGGIYTYTIKKFTPNTNIADSAFAFDASKHPDVEVIDLTEE